MYDIQAQQANRQHRQLIMLLDFCAEKSRRAISELDGSLGVAMASCVRPVVTAAASPGGAGGAAEPHRRDHPPQGVSPGDGPYPSPRFTQL